MKIIMYFPVRRCAPCAFQSEGVRLCTFQSEGVRQCMYLTALVFEEAFAKTVFAVVSCAVRGLIEFHSPVVSI